MKFGDRVVDMYQNLGTVISIENDNTTVKFDAGVVFIYNNNKHIVNDKVIDKIRKLTKLEKALK